MKIPESLAHLYQKTPYWIQNVCSSAYGLRKLITERNSRFRTFRMELLESEHYSTEKLRAIQDEKLRRLVAHAYANVPYYSKVFRERGLTPKDITGAEDLKKLPLMDKEI